jgi:hypothetical protein
MRRMLDGLAHDVRHAVRAARARPGVSLVVVVSLALALGANALLYSVVDATIVRPLPFPDLERLVGVGAAYPRLNEPLEYFEVLSAPEYLDIKSGVSSFGAAAGFDLGNEHVLANDVPERVFTAYFWDDPFPVLGITPAAGRSFTAEEVTSARRTPRIRRSPGPRLAPSLLVEPRLPRVCRRSLTRSSTWTCIPTT